MKNPLAHRSKYPRLRIAVLAFASGYLFANFNPFQWPLKTPTVIEVLNASEESISVVIRDSRPFHVGKLAAGEAKSKRLPSVGLYEVHISDSTGKVIYTGRVAPSSADGTRVLFKDGAISEEGKPHDA